MALRHEEEFVEIFERGRGRLVNGGDYGLPLVARQFVENLDDTQSLKAVQAGSWLIEHD